MYLWVKKHTSITCSQMFQGKIIYGDKERESKCKKMLIIRASRCGV